jgi:membrane protein implicated in regulation of membrane protease activity
MLRKTGFYIALLAVGVALAALSFLFTAEAYKEVQGVMLGIGAGLTGMSFANLLMKRYEKKNPGAARQSEIEFKDERNVLIRARARAAAGGVLQWIIIAFAFALILLDAPLGYTLTAVGIYVAYHVLSAIFMARYQKEL